MKRSLGVCLSLAASAQQVQLHPQKLEFFKKNKLVAHCFHRHGRAITPLLSIWHPPNVPQKPFAPACLLSLPLDMFAEHAEIDLSSLKHSKFDRHLVSPLPDLSAASNGPRMANYARLLPNLSRADFAPFENSLQANPLRMFNSTLKLRTGTAWHTLDTTAIGKSCLLIRRMTSSRKFTASAHNLIDSDPCIQLA